MNRLQHLLCILMEECNEVSQRASKALRFGVSEIQEGQPLNNTERVNIEFNDLIATIEMINTELASLSKDGDGFQIYRVPELVDLKKRKVEKYFRLSKSLGELKP